MASKQRTLSNLLRFLKIIGTSDIYLNNALCLLNNLGILILNFIIKGVMKITLNFITSHINYSYQF